MLHGIFHLAFRYSDCAYTLLLALAAIMDQGKDSGRDSGQDGGRDQGRNQGT
jgi:hypothetical protein